MLVERGEDVVPVTVLGVRYWNAGFGHKSRTQVERLDTCSQTHVPSQNWVSPPTPALCALKSIFISSNPSYAVISKSLLPFGL